jgi:putative transposase
LWRHVGASRFAYNHLLGCILQNWSGNKTRKEAGEEILARDYLSTLHFGLLCQWSDIRDEAAPWWAENGSSAYNDATQRLSKACANFHQHKSGFPRFKRKRQGVGSVRFVGPAVKLTDSHHVRISRVGVVKTFESTWSAAPAASSRRS